VAKKNNQLVQCRYPKCKYLHDTTELNKEDAIQGASRYYYHPDCYYTMRTINQIRDEFYTNVNPTLTGKQVGQLVSIVNNMVFTKHIDADYILFALRYYIKNKPDSLKHPGGIAYIVQSREVENAWKKERDRITRQRIKEELQKQSEEEHGGFELNNDNSDYKPDNKSKFSRVLGV